MSLDESASYCASVRVLTLIAPLAVAVATGRTDEGKLGITEVGKSPALFRTGIFPLPVPTFSLAAVPNSVAVTTNPIELDT